MPRPYRAELDAFAHSIRTGDPCSPSFEDGVAALVLANAAAESATTGKTVAITLARLGKSNEPHNDS